MNSRSGPERSWRASHGQHHGELEVIALVRQADDNQPDAGLRVEELVGSALALGPPP
jgi:hypothetical protein